MALERKPVKSQPEPEYPDSEKYAQERRQFLVKLGALAAGFITLAGCEDASKTTANPGKVTPVQVDPPVQQTQAAQPVAPMPGAPPVPNATPQAGVPGEASAVQPLANPEVQSPGKPAMKVDPVEPPARPQARELGDMKAPAQPQAMSKGNVAAPEPARPQAAIRGDVAAPELAAPQATAKGEMPSCKLPTPARPESQVEGGIKAPAQK